MGTSVVLLAATHCAILEGLKKCSEMMLVKQYHSQLVRLGLSYDNHVAACLIDSSRCLDYAYALKVFDAMPCPDTFLYNVVLKGRSSSESSFTLYSQMLEQFLLPNSFTFPLLIRGCRSLDEGEHMHAHVIKFGYADNSACRNNLIYMYLQCDEIAAAKKVYENGERDVVSVTSLISGYSKLGMVEEAVSLFDSIPTSLRCSASYNAIIAAFVRNNRYQDAFALFDGMLKQKGMKAVDKFIATTMLSACSGVCALRQGEWLYSVVRKYKIKIDSKLATAIVDMYCKCGCLQEAVNVFDELPTKTLSTWNSMIGGMGMFGEGEAAIALFTRMENEKITPDCITFLNLLCACAHSGLVQNGRELFTRMTVVYGIEPTAEIIGCMATLLGRAGFIEEAKNLIDENPSFADVSLYGALAGACVRQGNTQIGEEMAMRAIELEPNNSGRYSFLSNMYADDDRWQDVAMIRKLMNDRSVKKMPGCSMIEIDGTVTEFFSGGGGHPQATEIYSTLHSIKGQHELYKCFFYTSE